MRPARAMAAPVSWMAVSRTNPCEQIPAAWCKQDAAWPLLRSSHPPITAMARPAITRISARADPRRGQPVIRPATPGLSTGGEAGPRPCRTNATPTCVATPGATGRLPDFYRWERLSGRGLGRARAAGAASPLDRTVQLIRCRCCSLVGLLRELQLFWGIPGPEHIGDVVAAMRGGCAQFRLQIGRAHV